jgi:hypothetical protein
MLFESSIQMRRLAGLSGLAGALLFFAGDMLFYGYFGSGASFAQGLVTIVMHASRGRLYAGGLVGPVAACLCIVGFWHVCLNIGPANVLLRRLLFAMFFLLMVAGGAVHELWTAKGLAIHYCYNQGGPCPNLLFAVKSYWSVAYQFAAIPGYVGAVLLLGLVLLRRTYYPRWTVIANPGVLAILSPFAVWVPSPLGAILVGGFSNLSIAVFFVVSVITTWSIPDEGDTRAKLTRG